MVESTFDINNEVCKAILSALHYYSLFYYPLKAEEIYGSMDVEVSLANVLVALEDLENQQMVYRYQGYYSLESGINKLVDRRKKANGLATTKIKQAARVGRFISLFPFVRFVGISGSLSKGYADEESDFDYFIVTAENRLWICRTLLHLFKKATFLFGQQDKFCMNYFVDTHSLKIEEQNRFTAVELASIIPVFGYNSYLELKDENIWAGSFLPNGYVGFNNVLPDVHNGANGMKRVLEFIINTLKAGSLNKWLMQLTDNKWRRKWSRKNYPMEHYNTAFKTTLHISKNHPANHQQKILNFLDGFRRQTL